MPKVLLTGASGFVGSHVLNHLVASGWDVVITLRDGSNCWRIESQVNEVSVINLDEIVQRRFSLSIRLIVLCIWPRSIVKMMIWRN